MKWTLFVALIVLLLGVVFAEEHEHGSEMEEAFERKFEVSKNEAGEFEVRSEREDSHSEDEEEIRFNFKVTSGCGPSIRARYEGEIGGVESDFRTGIRLFRLVRYNDTAPYTNQTAEASIDLDSVSWNNLNCTATNGNYRCILSAQNGNINITADFVTAETTVDGVTTTPFSVKWGLQFRKGGVGSVALITRVVTKTEQESKAAATIEDESDDNKNEITTRRERQVKFGAAGYVSWVDDYTIAGVSAGNVAYSGLTTATGCGESDEVAKALVFSFTNQVDGVLEWDPKVGFSYSSAFAVVPSMVLAVLALIALLL